MDAQELARRAREMEGDPLVGHIFASLKERYTNEWCNSPPADLQKRETAYAAIRALEDIKGKISSLANAPKVDAHNNRNAAKR